MFYALWTDGSTVSTGYGLVFYVAHLPSSLMHCMQTCEIFLVHVYRCRLFGETSNDVFCMQEIAAGVMSSPAILLFLPGTCVSQVFVYVAGICGC